MIWPFKAIANTDLTRNKVDQRSGNKERRHAARAAFMDQQRGFGNGIQSTDTRADHHTGAQPAMLVFGHPARVSDGLLCGCNAIKNKIIHLAAFFGLHPVIRVKAAICAITQRHFACIFCCHAIRVKPGD